MRIVQQITELRGVVRAWRERKLVIGFVPTMGNLHEGHLALVKAAQRYSDRVVVSLFVNPTQFGQGEDYSAYPRTPEADGAHLQALAVDLLFAPTTPEIYPLGIERHTQVDVPALTAILCGAFRPGHFTGVATIVAKLLNIVQPDVALFGRKDYQQLLIIQRMVADLALPVQVIGVPTVREPDGLARSSRNAYLSAEQRAQAPALYRTLSEIACRLREEGLAQCALLEAQGCQALRQQGLCPDYVSIRRQADLLGPQAGDTELVVLAAAWLGEARLIDNVELSLNPRN